MKPPPRCHGGNRLQCTGFYYIRQSPPAVFCGPVGAHNPQGLAGDSLPEPVEALVWHGDGGTTWLC